MLLILGFAGMGDANLAGDVPLASNLVEEGRRAEQACMPLLLEFAAEYCEYCTLLEEEILKPMLLNRDYDRRVLMRKLVLDTGSRLPSFTGKQVHPADLASQYNIQVTPTLLFVDANGRELSERMVGVSTLDYYGGYLDQALDASRQRLRELKHCN